RSGSSPACSRSTSSDPAGELEAVELPSSLEVLQEQLEFVLRLSTDDLSSYPLLLACSLRKNASVAVDLAPID
ncbi:Os07g0112600, partial [Oryza sativa Japonica Group]